MSQIRNGGPFPYELNRARRKTSLFIEFYYILKVEDPFDQQERKKCPNRNPPAAVIKHIA